MWLTAKMEIQGTRQENDPGKDFVMDIQKKLIEALNSKVELQMVNQENDCDYDFLLDLQRRFAKTLG